MPRFEEWKSPSFRASEAQAVRDTESRTNTTQSVPYNHGPGFPPPREWRTTGWKWKGEEETSSYHGPFVTPLATREYDEKIVGYEIAQKNIDTLINWILQCSVTGKPFKIIKQELVFYIENDLPLPTKHPDQRHRERNALRNKQELYERGCDNCGLNIQTTYEPAIKNVVCEACYLKLVH